MEASSARDVVEWKGDWILLKSRAPGGLHLLLRGGRRHKLTGSLRSFAWSLNGITFLRSFQLLEKIGIEAKGSFLETF